MKKSNQSLARFLYTSKGVLFWRAHLWRIRKGSKSKNG